MSLLVDWQIRKLCAVNGHAVGHRHGLNLPMIEPFADRCQTPGKISYGLDIAGYSVRLGNDFWVSKNTANIHLDPKRFKEPGYLETVADLLHGDSNGVFTLPPHGSALAVSVETIRVPRWLLCLCVGKSTYARVFVTANLTPLEPGWGKDCEKNVVTIELSNMCGSPVDLHVGEGIVQVLFMKLDAEPEVDYAQKGGIYQGQTGVTPPRVREG